MALSVPNPVLGTGTSDSTKIDANFNAVVSKFGNIDNADIKAAAGIDISKLSASHFEVVFNLCLTANNAIPAANANRPLVLCAVPQDDTTSSYLTTSYAWACTDSGTAGTTTTFKVEYGSFTGAGNIWVNHQTILAATSIPTVVGTRPESAGNTVAVTLSQAVGGSIVAPRFIGLFFTAVGAGFLDPAATGESFTFTLKAKRTLGLRT